MATAYALKYDVDLTQMPLCSEDSISGKLLIVHVFQEKSYPFQYADGRKMALQSQKPA
jgi:hypothetical protein